MKVPNPIFKLSLKGNAHAKPYFINPNSNLTASLGISPKPFNLNESVFANFGFLGPKLKNPAHLDWDPSAITRNSDIYVNLLSQVISHLSFFLMIFSINDGLII